MSGNTGPTGIPGPSEVPTTPTQNFEVRVTKFDKMFDSGTVCVGFVVTTNTGKSLFIDKTINIPSSETGVTDSQLIDMAWNELSSTIQTWIQANTAVLSPVGMAYIPPRIPTDTSQ